MGNEKNIIIYSKVVLLKTNRVYVIVERRVARILRQVVTVTPVVAVVPHQHGRVVRVVTVGVEITLAIVQLVNAKPLHGEEPTAAQEPDGAHIFMVGHVDALTASSTQRSLLTSESGMFVQLETRSVRCVKFLDFVVYRTTQLNQGVSDFVSRTARHQCQNEQALCHRVSDAASVSASAFIHEDNPD